MCVVITKEPGQRIEEDVIRACIAANDDGFGAAWFDGSRVRRARMMTHLGDHPNGTRVHTIEEVLKFCKKIEQHRAFLHFRWSTHGRKVIDNCHPFVVGLGKAAFCHNGIFSGVDSHKDWSDTRCVASWLNSHSEKTINGNLKGISDWHGTGNRTAFLFSDGQIARTGSWQEHQGLMFSNLNWRHAQHCYTHVGGERKGKRFVYGSEIESRKLLPFHEDSDEKKAERIALGASTVASCAASNSTSTTTPMTDAASFANRSTSSQGSTTTRLVIIKVWAAPDKDGNHCFCVYDHSKIRSDSGRIIRGKLRAFNDAYLEAGYDIHVEFASENVRYQDWLYQRSKERVHFLEKSGVPSDEDGEFDAQPGIEAEDVQLCCS